MSKTRVMFAMFSIVAILLCVSHICHFVSPLIQMSSGGTTVISDEDGGDDMTSWEFAQLALFFDQYDWENYNADDFPDWLYMPEETPDWFNASNDEMLIPPFYGYHWDTYNPDDFPNWILAPDELPDGFNSTNPEHVLGFMMMYIDPELMEDMEDMTTSEGTDGTDETDGTDMGSGDIDFGAIIGDFVNIYELIYGVIALGVAIVLFIVSRSVE